MLAGWPVLGSALHRNLCSATKGESVAPHVVSRLFTWSHQVISPEQSGVENSCFAKLQSSKLITFLKAEILLPRSNGK